MPDTTDIEMKLLLQAIYLRYQHDFRNYSPSTLQRRLNQALANFECASLSQLQHRLLREPDLFTELLPYLTVQVSDMFRDPEYYLALRRQVVPLLQTYPSIKVWIAGCSTGEELWSFAILLHEEGLLERTSFYATDINPQALRSAQAAVYPLERIADFSRNYLAAGGKGSLSDYYVAAYDAASFSRALKINVVFADHSLATDHVFSEVHLVSCRNVLIYFDRELQNRAVGLFREALVRRGFLGLGSKESLRFNAHTDAFDTLCVPEKIYQKR